MLYIHIIFTYKFISLNSISNWAVTVKTTTGQWMGHSLSDATWAATHTWARVSSSSLISSSSNRVGLVDWHLAVNPFMRPPSSPFTTTVRQIAQSKRRYTFNISGANVYLHTDHHKLAVIPLQQFITWADQMPRLRSSIRVGLALTIANKWGVPPYLI